MLNQGQWSGRGQTKASADTGVVNESADTSTSAPNVVEVNITSDASAMGRSLNVVASFPAASINVALASDGIRRHRVMLLFVSSR